MNEQNKKIYTPIKLRREWFTDENLIKYNIDPDSLENEEWAYNKMVVSELRKLPEYNTEYYNQPLMDFTYIYENSTKLDWHVKCILIELRTLSWKLWNPPEWKFIENNFLFISALSKNRFYKERLNRNFNWDAYDKAESWAWPPIIKRGILK